MEGPDWKKYTTKSSHYSHSSDIDYLMLKPSGPYGKYGQLSESAYMSAMHYSGTWVVVAILSILLGMETFLTHLKVYIGVESVSASAIFYICTDSQKVNVNIVKVHIVNSIS